MAASTVKMNGSWGRMALALVLSALLLHGCVVCDDATVTPAASPEDTAAVDAATDAIAAQAVPTVTVPTDAVSTVAVPANAVPTVTVQGGVIPTDAPTMAPTDKSQEDNPTTAVLTTAPEAVPLGAVDQTTAGPATLDTTQTPSESTAALETGSTLAATQEARTDAQQTTEALTSGPATDQVSSIATAVPTDTQTPEQTAESATIFQTVTDTRAPAAPEITHIIQCVEKEAISDKDAIKLELEDVSGCEVTKGKMKNIATDLCEGHCKLDIFQEENSNIVIVSGLNIEDNVMPMVDKFNSERIKEELGLIEATPHRGEHPPTILVALLISGLLLAALLIGGYCLKERRSHRSKGMRLAEESYEENQGNTLVSVAPLSSLEPQEKPSVNGESPNGAKTHPPPAATNGHSTAKAPMADTEL